MIRKAVIQILLLVTTQIHFGQETKYELETNIRYYTDTAITSDQYAVEKCVLDIYYPKDKKGFSTVIWFHGGGLTGGDKFIPSQLKNKGIAIVAINYRLYPKVINPTYIMDAAAAVAWVFKNIDNFGGDNTKIFVSGHSAGGYLASMVGLDKKWLGEHNIDANSIAGLVPFSGHAITHFTIRKENAIPGTQPIIDEYAPLYHVREDAPPFLLITGDRELELLGRYEENAYFLRMMKVSGHRNIDLLELDGYGHQMIEPAFPLLLKFMSETVERN